MEFGRRFGLLRPKTVPSGDPKSEVTEYEAKRWEEAFLGKSLFQQDVYALLLALCNDPSKKIYASLVVDPLKPYIDIPLIDHTPQDVLARRAYMTTFFGEVVPEKYHAFATDEFIRDHLLALLNRKTAGVSPDEVSKWFYTTFRLEHLKRYGPIYIGSHGGANTYGYDHHATIESSSQADGVKGMTTRAAVDFAKVVQRSLPHLIVEPLPIDTYLQDVQSTLKFLPRDWEV